jgi:hypothetical protein
MAISSFCFMPPDRRTNWRRQDAIDIEPEALGDVVDALRVGAAQRRRKIDQLADRHLQRRRQLRHEADGAEHRRAVAARVEAVDGDLALVGVFAEQAADQGGLAGAVRADQRDALAEADIEADAVEHAGAAEGFGDVLNWIMEPDYRGGRDSCQPPVKRRMSGKYQR